MRTLILGNGLIGKAIARKLVTAKHDIVIASRSADDKIDGVKYVQNSFEEIVNNATLFANADNVIHTICTSSPASSMQDIYKDAYENVLLNVKLIEMLRQHPVQKLIFLSSGGSVYGNEAVTDVDEKHPTHPISAYGVAKINVEKYLYLYGYHFGLNYLVLRPSNVYGYIKNLKKSQGVINHIIDCTLRNKQFKLWGSLENRKDYLYVDDLAEAVAIALQRKEKYTTAIYNLSNGITSSLGMIITMVEKVTGKRMNMEVQEGAKFDVSSINVNGFLFKTDFNWTPQYDIESGIRKIISQY
ncbi:MAG: NAD-dependent epimerase/dehydratase family protein [Chitinophagaceae bacterium]